MKLQIYQVVHVGAMVLMTAFLFQAFANPDPKNKKRSAILIGSLGLLTLIGGFGLVSVLHVGFPWWVIVKLVCWFGLVSYSGLAYRSPGRIPLLTGVSVALILIAITTVYFKNAIAG